MKVLIPVEEKELVKVVSQSVAGSNPLAGKREGIPDHIGGEAYFRKAEDRQKWLVVSLFGWLGVGWASGNHGEWDFLNGQPTSRKVMMAMKVLSPVGAKRSANEPRELAPRLDALAGKVIGIVDDGGGKAYFQRIEELLNERVKPKQIIHRTKALSQPAPAELLEELAKTCDAVIVGVGI